jgi:hypothetical protein
MQKLYTYLDEDGNPSGPPLVEENVRHLFADYTQAGTVSFSQLSVNLLSTKGLVEIKNSAQPPTEEWEDIRPGAIVKNPDGTIEQTWIITEISPAEKYRRWIHGQRMHRLVTSDWTQLSDSPLSADDKQAWATYRQKLRDITDTIDLSKLKSHLGIPWPKAPWNPEDKWGKATNP